MTGSLGLDVHGASPASFKLRKMKSGWVGPPVEDKSAADGNHKDDAEWNLDGSQSSVGTGSKRRHSKLMFSPLAAHLPDQVVNSDHFKSFPHMKRFQAGILFLDISGFTALCEKFSMASKHGTDKLTKTLNGYMGNLAQEIINYDGDIMKYAGDAILTLWPVSSILDIQPTMWHMYNCCMSIQKKFGKWETDVGVILKVKIGVSFGDVAVCYVGNDEYRHYVTNGKAVESVNMAEKFCTSGDVVFSPSAWPHVRNLNIPYTVCADGEHVYVHELREYDDEEPREVAAHVPKGTLLRTDDTIKDFKEDAKEEASESTRSKVDVAPPMGLSIQDVSSDKWKTKRRKSAFRDIEKSDCRVRKTVVGKLEETLNDALRLFITLPVLQKLDHNQPLAYLSEMRQVSILFINITMEPAVKMSKWQQCKLLQSAFAVIYPAAQSFHGCMNKIFMFDKGITFLVLFGLPGYKQENDCMHALQCSHSIKQQLDNIPGIDCVSIGVTTGSSFCGVVGHDHRHEYTVIGRKVNMAARLMMHYPDCITCDHNTYHHSKLPKGDFVVQEAKAMKGLVEIGTIRQYCEGLNGTTDAEDVSDSMKIPEFFFPMIGRDKELAHFKEVLENTRSCKDTHKQLQLLLYKGEAGIGRTRLLGAIMSVAIESEVKVISTALTMHDRKTPYFTVKSMLMGLIGLGQMQSHQEREHIIRERLTNRVVSDHLCMLNDLLGVKFVVDEKHKHMDVSTWTKTLHEVFSKIAEQMCQKYGFVIFVIDDGHFMDEESWDFIVDLSRNMKALVVIAIKSGVGKTKWCNAAKTIMEDERLTLTIKLKGLADEYLAVLACQFLKVLAIPREVESLLKEKSHGVPWWCEQIIWQLHREHCITVIKDTKGEIMALPEMIKPDRKSFIPRHSNLNVTELSNILYGMGMSETGESDSVPMVCVTTKKFDFQNVDIPDSIKGIILARLDTMDTTDQMVVKCASILGVSFTQTLLCNVLPKVSTRRLGGSIHRLMKQNIFLCDQKRQLEASMQRMMSDNKSEFRNCTCEESLPDDAPDTGVFCQWLRFGSTTVQETAYEMFVENTRQHLHRSAAIYYEQQAHRCRACGGGNFLSGAVHEAKGSRMNLRQDTGSKTESRTSTFLRTRHFPRNNQVDNLTETHPSGDDKEERSFKDLDVRNCQCPSVLKSIYPQLVRHWRAVTDIEKTFHYLLEAAAAAIAVADNLQALAHLKDAEQMVDHVLDQKNPFTSDFDRRVDSDIFSRWDKARLQSLLGQAQYFLGQVDESVPHFLSAMKLLYNYQPQTKWRMALRTFQERRVHWLHEHFPKKYVGKAKETRSKWLVEQAHCLSHIFQVNLQKNDRRMALLTVLQLVNCSEKVNYCAHEVIVAYTAMLEYSKSVNAKGLLKKYERKARQRCEDVLSGRPNLQDVLMVIHVYITILHIRAAVGPLNEAVGAGLRAEHLSSILCDNDDYLMLLPLLIHVLLGSNRLIESVERTFTLQDLEEKADDIVAKTWFFNSCMELVLNAGIEVLHPKSLSKFANHVAAEHASNVAPLPVFALAASLSLWYVRTGNIPQASHWMNVCKDKKADVGMNCYVSMCAMIRIQEARLIMLARAIAWGLDENAKSLEEEIILEFKEMKDANGGIKSCILLLQAYYALLRGHQFISNRHISACINTAKELQMAYMVSWAEACQKGWANQAEPCMEWIETTTNGMPKAKSTDKKDLEVTFYILPFPSWIKDD